MNENNDNVRRIVVRLTPMRICMTLLYVLWSVYALMAGNWLAAGVVIPVLIYQWMYYVTFDEAVRMAHMGSHVLDAMRALEDDYTQFREDIKKMMEDNRGSDA